MNEVMKFDFESNTIRTQTDDNGAPWFNALDVCKALEYSNPRDALAKHVNIKDVAKRDTLTRGGIQMVNYINESGMYALILGSKKASAKRFQHWVTSEVLPTIRKTGSYDLQHRQAETSSSSSVSKKSLEAADEFEAIFRTSTLMGFDRNQAAFRANRWAFKATGVSLLERMEETALIAVKQQQLYNVTQIGEFIGLKATDVNHMLCDKGYQTAKTVAGVKTYELTDKGREFGTYLDVPKAHTKGGTTVKQIKWYEGIRTALQ